VISEIYPYQCMQSLFVKGSLSIFIVECFPSWLPEQLPLWIRN